MLESYNYPFDISTWSLPYLKVQQIKSVKVLPIHTSPAHADTDGDGALDNEDKYPQKYNKKISYIFYPYGGDDFLFEEAIARECEFEWEDNNDNVQLIAILNQDDFVNEWNAMGVDNYGKKEYIIDEVHLIFHGFPNGIMLSSDGYLYSDKVVSGYKNKYIAISDLSPKEINYLNISSCNGGNLDFTSNNIANYRENLAIAFLKSDNKINKVTAWDGSASYSFMLFSLFGFKNYVVAIESSKATESFLIWSKTVNNGKERKAEQQITYWKDKNGNIQYSPNEKHFLD